MEEYEFIQGGHVANKNGRVLEDAVRSIAKTHGYKETNYKDWIKLNKPINYLVDSVPYITIYGTTGKTEFLFATSTGNIRVECKWQQSAGSVDEKYPYLFENMKTVDENTVIIILDGNGYKRKAKEWLDTKCKGCTEKTIRLFSMVEFIVWANKHLPKVKHS